MSDESKRQQLAEERRAHNRKMEQLRSEYAPGRDIDAEFQAHQSRIGEILGDENQPCVGSAGGPTT